MISIPHTLQRVAPRLGSPLFSAAPASVLLAVLAAVLATALAGCKPLPPSKPASEFTEEEARGAQVFAAHCSRCHYPTSTKGLKGPGLQAITKGKSLPSGAPPTDERITAVILHGRGLMPAQPVPDDQLAPLLAYLHTL